MQSTEETTKVTCVMSDFLTPAPWQASIAGGDGNVRLTGRELRYDFTAGTAFIKLTPPVEESVLGNPLTFHVRVRGGTPGHELRLRLATHFMTFERPLGVLLERETEFSVAAPPGEGWRWFGGENDGQLHGPLRLRGLALHSNGRPACGRLELVDLSVTSAFQPGHACLLLASCRPESGRFTATIRSLSDRELAGTLRWVVRDWHGTDLDAGQRAVCLPPLARPLEVSWDLPAGQYPFLEAEVRLETEGQFVAPARACFTRTPELDHDQRPAPDSVWGMGVYLYRNSPDPAGLSAMEHTARLAAQIGVKWSREEFNWARIQPKRDTYAWDFYDNLVATARRHGITVYGLLAYWSSWTEPYSAEGISDYCRFVRAVVARYRGDIRHWEVWNEPNIFFWKGPRDLYAELLRQAYQAIKQANSDAVVLGCSTCGIDLPFIRRILELNAPFDALTVHPYRETLDDAAFIADLRAAAELVRLPDGTHRPVWITEMGWATYADNPWVPSGWKAPVSERRQAELLARTYLDAIASGVCANVSWYDFREDGRDPFNFEHHLGILTFDSAPKPACRAFAVLTRLLESLHFDRKIELKPRVSACRFADCDGHRSVLALWCADHVENVRVPVDKPSYLLDLMGNAYDLPARDGHAEIRLQPGSPVFAATQTNKAACKAFVLQATPNPYIG